MISLSHTTKKNLNKIENYDCKDGTSVYLMMKRKNACDV